MTDPAENKTAVERIQHVAHQLGVMVAGAPANGSMARMLKEMALDLNLALEAMDETTAESVQQHAQRVLNESGVHGVNPLFVGVTWEGHQDLNYLVEQWGWTDQDLRDKLRQYIVCDMLGISEREYKNQMNVNAAGLMSRFYEAHERWA